jgi:uncharacterized protein YbdZ (MbtH family)
MSATAEAEFRVVINHEGQYSLWPTYRERPRGWEDAGCRGTRDQCLDFIEREWRDMRPRSLIAQLESVVDGAQPADEACVMPPLVERLQRTQRVELARLHTIAELAEQIERGFVFVRFVETQGGTELGFELDRAASDLSGVDWEARRGQLKLSGTLTLDFEPVRVCARINLASADGEGELVRLVA